MDSFMEVDNSDYRREVVQQNTLKPSPGALHGKRSRANFEGTSSNPAAVLPDAPPYQSPTQTLRARLGRVQQQRGSQSPYISSSPIVLYPHQPSKRVPKYRERPRRPALSYAGPALRRIGGFILSTIRRSCTVAGAIWTVLTTEGTEPAEIVAVETDTSGRKRRAVEAVPPATMVTPPDSRPSSRQELEEQTWVFDPNMTLPTMLTETDLGTSDVGDVATGPKEETEVERVLPSAWPRETTPPPRSTKLAKSPTSPAEDLLAGRVLPSAWPREATPPPRSTGLTKSPTSPAKALLAGRTSPTAEHELPRQPSHASRPANNPSLTRSREPPQQASTKPQRPALVNGRATDGRPPGVRQTGLWMYSDAYPICQDRIDIPRPTFQRPPTFMRRPVRLPACARPGYNKSSRGVEQDKKVDSLVQRAERLKLGTEEEQLVRSTYRQRKEAEEAARKERIRLEEEQRKAELLAAQLKKEEEERLLRLAEEEARKRETALIRELDPVWKEKLSHAMEARAAGKVLARGPEGNDLTRKDFGTLLAAPGSHKADAWLNDEIVNAWFASIVQQKLEQAGYVKGSAAPFAAYNSAWYNKVRAEGADSLKRWSRRKGIQNEKLLQAEKIYLPINTGAHWLLLIISPTERTLEVLDSMRGSPAKYFQCARDLLQMELGKKYVASEWTESKAASSLQDNTDDCGAFTCWNGLASAKQRSYEEVTARKMQDARRLMGAILLNGGFTGDFAL